LAKVCRATKRNGQPCTGPATGSSCFCWAHDPAHAAERKAIASKGGKGRTGGRLADLDAKLDALYEATASGQLDRGTAAVLNQILISRMRLLEAEHKLAEVAELERTVQAIVEYDKMRGVPTATYYKGK
jgi:hypothetical protein